MHSVDRLRITALAICYALVPPRATTGCIDQCLSSAPPLSSSHPDAVEGSGIRLHLADLSRSVRNDGTLALFFPGCCAAAAPFLLFRLKRMGFSSCRATVTAAGLTLTAIR